MSGVGCACFGVVWGLGFGVCGVRGRVFWGLVGGVGGVLGRVGSVLGRVGSGCEELFMGRRAGRRAVVVVLLATSRAGAGSICVRSARALRVRAIAASGGVWGRLWRGVR